MISGEYEITKDKTEWSERTMDINLVIVTAEESDRSSDKFLEELEALLQKYAI